MSVQNFVGNRAALLAVCGLVAGSVFFFSDAGDALAMTAKQVDATKGTVEVAFTQGANESDVEVTGVESKTTDTQEWVEVPGEYIEVLTAKRAVLTNLEPGFLISQVRFSYRCKYGQSSQSIPRQTEPISIATVTNEPFNLKIAGQLYDTKKLKVSFKNPGGIDGYEIRLSALSGKKYDVSYRKTYGVTSQSYRKNLTTDWFSASFNTAYKVKARTWVTMDDSAKTKKYSAWSSSKLLVPQPDLQGKRHSSSVNLNWNKVKGATSYSVYASVSKDAGFKKVATTKSAKLVVKKVAGKKLVKGTSYYFYVKANAKMGKRSYSSPSTRVFVAQ